MYREIESLEKSHVGTRDFIDYQDTHLVFRRSDRALFIELALGATVFGGPREDVVRAPGAGAR